MKFKKIWYLLGTFVFIFTPLVITVSCSSNNIIPEQKQMNDIKLSDVLSKIDMVKKNSALLPSDALKNSKIKYELYNQEINGLNELAIKTSASYDNIQGKIYFTITIIKFSFTKNIKPKVFCNEEITGYKKESADNVFQSITGEEVVNALNFYSDYKKLSNEVSLPTTKIYVMINSLKDIYVEISNWRPQPNDGTIVMDINISYNQKNRILPYTISGYKVILNNSNETDLTLITNNNGNITIQEKVTEIAPSTFINGKFAANDIKSISFGVNSHLKVIGAQAFQGVEELDNPLNFPDSLYSIDSLAFSNLNNIKNLQTSSLSHLFNIGDYAFASLNLNSLIIPQSVGYIGNGAFLNSTFYNSTTKEYKLSFQGIDPANDTNNRKLLLGLGAFDKYLVSNIKDIYWQNWAAHSPQSDAFA